MAATAVAALPAARGATQLTRQQQKLLKTSAFTSEHTYNRDKACQDKSRVTFCKFAHPTLGGGGDLLASKESINDG